MKPIKQVILLCFLAIINFGNFAQAESIMINPLNRSNVEMLNGKWNALIDPQNVGQIMGYFHNTQQTKTGPNIEYLFSDVMRLDVPSDFNSQMPELKFYEGNIWYQRKVKLNKKENANYYLYFAGASYYCKVWLNGKNLGDHEGGFLPFQFDITKVLKNGENELVVLVNNERNKDNIPAMRFDWWNYGGITRDVMIVQTPTTYIQDYKIQLKKGSKNTLAGHVQVEGNALVQQVDILIPELKLKKIITTNDQGFATFEFAAKPQLWSPETPKLYTVSFKTKEETVNEEIGFRTIEVNGTKILLNGNQVFLKGISFHEEIAQRMGRAYSAADAAMILSEAKALGCNFIRTAHYPQNEYIVRMAEKMGLMIWEEIPVWQGINFTNELVMAKAKNMLNQMIQRDKNRAGIIIWSIANETIPNPARDAMLIELAKLARTLDNTRLIGGAFDNMKYDKLINVFSIEDNLIPFLDIVGVNKYMGWYMKFPVDPSEIMWKVALDKPLIFSEFGAEALYGQHGETDVPSSWSEEYQEKLYQDNLVMFKNIPNLSGTVPWILFDFRSPTRNQMKNQDNWNRKGLVSDKGMRKKAWYVMKEYYESK